MNIRSLLFSVLLLLAASAHAQVIISVTGKLSSAALGYSANTNYTFTFTTVSTFANTSASSFTSSITEWQSTPGVNGPLFSSITGSGLSGSLTSGLIMQDISAGANGGKNLEITTYRPASGTDPIGISANTIALKEIYLNIAPTGASPFSFTNGASYIDLPNFFGSYNGTYDFSSVAGTVLFKLSAVGAIHSPAEFAVSSIQITSAIPEPSTYGLLAGCAVLGAVCWRRRRRGAHA